MFAPEGDFNSDGNPDIAISGIFQFENIPHKYFLMVANEKKNPLRYEKLFYAAYDKPVYIHTAGSTGEADPGDQAFSITFCAYCDDGRDFYWNKSNRAFDLRPWKAKVNRFQKTVTENAKEVPAEDIDKALQIAGGLKDVVAFTEGAKKKNAQLVVRVEYENERRGGPRYWVRIFEKEGEEEVLYDRILVDIEKSKVLRREKRR